MFFLLVISFIYDLQCGRIVYSCVFIKIYSEMNTTYNKFSSRELILKMDLRYTYFYRCMSVHVSHAENMYMCTHVCEKQSDDNTEL